MRTQNNFKNNTNASAIITRPLSNTLLECLGLIIVLVAPYTLLMF